MTSRTTENGSRITNDGAKPTSKRGKDRNAVPCEPSIDHVTVPEALLPTKTRVKATDLAPDQLTAFTNRIKARKNTKIY